LAIVKILGLLIFKVDQEVHTVDDLLINFEDFRGLEVGVLLGQSSDGLEIKRACEVVCFLVSTDDGNLDLGW
jgi:hypothetical protein